MAFVEMKVCSGRKSRVVGRGWGGVVLGKDLVNRSSRVSSAGLVPASSSLSHHSCVTMWIVKWGALVLSGAIVWRGRQAARSRYLVGIIVLVLCNGLPLIFTGRKTHHDEVKRVPRFPGFPVPRNPSV